MSTLTTQLDANLACDACRVKKLKCSKQRPSCKHCIHHGRACNYSGKVNRSPLTRVYLSQVERRLNRLEQLFSELLPDVNLEKALRATGTRSYGTASTSVGPSDDLAREQTEDSISEVVPEEADGFDWQEDVDELADGMAALSVEPKGTGYLGATAGVFFLRSLLFWLGHSTTYSETQSQAIRSPSFDPACLSQSLSSRHVLDQLIDSYFAVYHRTYPFIHEASFRAQFNGFHIELIPRPHHRSWQMLLHTVLALGAWCLNEEVDDNLYHHALSFGEDESMFESANITFVQALVLLSNLSQKRNKPNTGSNFLGLATRMALSLGLHRELQDWDIGLLQREMRRRAWWGLYMFDSGACITFGRPILLPGKESMDVRPVLNIPDELLTARTVVMPAESTEPTLYSGLKWQSDFHVHSNHISNRLLSSTGVSPEDAISMGRSLDSWSETLPRYFRLDQDSNPAFLFEKSRLWWRIWNLKITIFRQILLKRAAERSKQRSYVPSSETDEKCMSAAVQAASSTIASIHYYSQNGLVTRLVSWYSIYFLFHASLVIALAILGDTESPLLPSWQADIENTRHVFRVLYADNPLANRCADILDLIVPGSAPVPLDWANVQLDPALPALMDFSAWPNDAGDFLSLFGYPENGPGA